MTTAEERIASLETRADVQEQWLRSIDTKLDTLIAAMNVGKGVWFAMLKMGTIAGAIIAVFVGLNSIFHWR